MFVLMPTMFGNGHQCQVDNIEGYYWIKNESLRAVDEEIAVACLSCSSIRLQSYELQ